MKRERIGPRAAEDVEHRPAWERNEAGGRRKRHRWTIWIVLLIFLVVAGVVVRLQLPGFARDYVNRTIDRNPLYTGKIGDIEINLWRGAYSIHDVRLNKVVGDLPVPLFKAERVDFAVQWRNLRRGKIVARVLVKRPELNFVDASESSNEQTGEGGPWLQMLSDLFPFRINRAVIQDGSVHFRAYGTRVPVDVYLSEVQATIDNLSNIKDETKPLVSTVQVSAKAMDQADMELNMVMDPFSYRPTFHLGARLLNLDVTRLNALAQAYGKFDFEKGWFDLVVEADAKEGQLTGYIKPLFRNLKIFSVRGDLEGENPLEAFWQALLGVVTNVFKNQPRDQFGTLIPFRGDLTATTTANLMATVGNLLRNAFVRAYLPQLQGGSARVGNLVFGPPELAAPISVGAAP